MADEVQFQAELVAGGVDVANMSSGAVEHLWDNETLANPGQNHGDNYEHILQRKLVSISILKLCLAGKSKAVWISDLHPILFCG